MNQAAIGSFLKELRKEKGLTQEQLAEQFHVNRRTVSRWETGNNLPDLDLLIELSDYYGVELRAGERRACESGIGRYSAKSRGIQQRGQAEGKKKNAYLVHRRIDCRGCVSGFAVCRSGRRLSGRTVLRHSVRHDDCGRSHDQQARGKHPDMEAENPQKQIHPEGIEVEPKEQSIQKKQRSISEHPKSSKRQTLQPTKQAKNEFGR